jgi:phosphoribosyl-AMP cyclohydrolase
MTIQCSCWTGKNTIYNSVFVDDREVLDKKLTQKAKEFQSEKKQWLWLVGALCLV